MRLIIEASSEEIALISAIHNGDYDTSDVNKLLAEFYSTDEEVDICTTVLSFLESLDDNISKAVRFFTKNDKSTYVIIESIEFIDDNLFLVEISTIKENKHATENFS